MLLCVKESLNLYMENIKKYLISDAEGTKKLFRYYLNWIHLEDLTD